MSSPRSTLWMLPCLQRGMFRQTPRTLCSDIIIVLIKAHIAAIIPLLLPAFDIFRWHLITWCPRGRQQRSRRSPIPPPWNTPDPARSEIVSTKPINLFVNQSVCLSVCFGTSPLYKPAAPLQRPLISKPHPNNPWLFGPSFIMAKNLAMFMKYNYLLECTSRPFTLLKYIRSSTRLFLTMIPSIIWIISVGKN